MSRKFAASTDAVNFGNVTTFNGATALTIACWVNLDDVANAATGRRWVSKWGTTFATSDSFLLAQNDADGTNLSCATLTNSTNYGIWRSTTAPFSTGVWIHVAFVWSGGTSGNIYINGAALNPANTGAGTPTGLQNVTTAFTFGQDGDAENGLLGSLSEVALWTVALTAAEVLALSLGVSPRVIETASLQYYVPCVGNVSPEVNQIDGVTGTVTGAGSNVLPPKVVAERALLLTG